jgi:hypothetical protein
MTKNRNLKGYKREGKRFIPPMKQLEGLKVQNYVNDMLPELVWLGLIHDRKGYVFGRDVLDVVLKVVKDGESKASAQNVNFALQYAYGLLNQDEKDSIVCEWAKKSMLSDIQYALAPLTLLYDGFSMKFVGPPCTMVSESTLIRRMSECVANHIDKSGVPAVALHGSMMLARLLTGKMFFRRGMDLPDFNAAINAPNSDEGRRAAGFLRASALADMGSLEVSNAWAKEFWNRNAVLSPCAYPSFSEDSDE